MQFWQLTTGDLFCIPNEPNYILVKISKNQHLWDGFIYPQDSSAEVIHVATPKIHDNTLIFLNERGKIIEGKINIPKAQTYIKRGMKFQDILENTYTLCEIDKDLLKLMDDQTHNRVLERTFSTKETVQAVINAFNVNYDNNKIKLVNYS